MLTRILTASVLIPILVLVLIFSHTLLFPIVWALVALIAVFELLRAFGTIRNIAATWPAYPIAAGLPFVAFFVDGSTMKWKIALCALAFLLLWLFGAAVFCRGKLSFSEISASFTGVLYISLAFFAMQLLRFDVPKGKYLYLLIFIGPWVTDTFAYFCGRFFGKHKLIPEISPKKTVEGAIGGTVFGAVAFVVFGIIMQKAYGLRVNYAMLAVSGLLTAVVSQLGDLIASLIKREHGVKDYSSLFPGHGGVMDRFDSVLATSILLCCIFSLGGALTVLS